MSWCDDFIHLAKWALMSEDLRHRYIYAKSADELPRTPGIARGLEVTAILAVYQAALGKGYYDGESVAYERPYPGYDGQNPPRADLAFKDWGQGQNWAYIEAKQYRIHSKKQIASDIKKLRGIQQRSQRWVFVYRIRRTDGHAAELSELLKKNFHNQLIVHADESFPSVPKGHNEEGSCDLCLARVR